MDARRQPTREQLAWMYERMVLSRRFEAFMTEAYLEGKQPVFDFTKGPLPGEMHISSGQEPCAVGICVHLQRSDMVCAPHRLHHIAIAKGVPLKPMAAEILGRKTGLSGGRGGHMHLFDPDVCFGSTGIVGQGIGTAAGHALAAQVLHSGAVAVAFVGEGAANQGMFHEAMNLAGLWKLPFILVIEDNRWGISVSKDKSTAIARNSDRAAGYAAVGEYIAGNDVFAIFDAAARAVERARAGQGPTILEIETYRLAGHFVGDTEVYVPEDERTQRCDPIDVLAARMRADHGFSDAEIAAFDATAAEQVGEARRYAYDSPYPGGEEALAHVFA